jgi:gliding motility-associated-like protein
VSNVTLNVLPLPNVNAGPDQVLCEGTSVTLNASGAASYTWNGGVANGSPFIQPVGSQTYQVIGTDGNSCTNSDVVTVTVNPNPNTYAGIDQSICLGETITLSGSGAVSYVWSNNVLNNMPFTPNSSLTYTVTGTDNNGCSSTDQVTINVNPVPTISVNGPAILCEGELAVFSGIGGQSYSWSDGIINGAPFNPGVAGNYSYTLIGSDINGCVDTTLVGLTVLSSPAADFVSNVLSGCAPLNVELQSTGDIGVSCNWTINNTNYQSCIPVNLTLDQTGCYDVSLTITDASGCSSTTQYNDYICVDENPTASFYTNTAQISGYSPEVNFINTSQNASTYYWDFGDGEGFSTLSDPSYEYLVFGNNLVVTLYAYSENGCSDSTNMIIQTEEEIIYYVPNAFSPDGDMYNQTFKPILSSGIDPYNYSFQIFNRWGELIFESLNPDIGWDGTYGDQNAQTGTYVWKIQLKVPNNDKRVELVGHLNLLR